MRVTTVGDVSEQVRGVSYAKSAASDVLQPGYSPILRANNISENGLLLDALVFVPDAKISQKQRIAPNDVIVAASSGSLSVVGKTAQAREGFEGGFGAFCKVLRPRPAVDPHYFGHYFRTSRYRHVISRLAAGANINNLRNEHLDNLQIPLPPLDEQKRIAGILDAADALRAKRREALGQLDILLQSTFLDMFGDPVTNPMGWPPTSLSAISEELRDGPFGSNLKTSHYVESGVRVIRLQNIGIGEMRNDDLAFISEEHFASLPRNHCQPGDVIIGTMGDPNLRACIVPLTLAHALNKADCILMRVDMTKVDAIYVCWLLNNPCMVSMARRLVRGQTRGRISLGRLKELQIHLPPIELQHRFAAIVESVEEQKTRQRAHLAELDTLFASLQSRAFRGDL